MKNDRKTNQYRVNEQIRVREVRIVGENGSTVLPTRQALDMARQQSGSRGDKSQCTAAGLSSHRLQQIPLSAEETCKGT